MRTGIILSVVALCGLVLGGCAFNTKSPVTGFLYSSVKDADSIGTAPAPSKTGRACATSILGMVAFGDSSIETAAKQGGITSISYVDREFTGYVLVYAETCTVVKGN